MNFGFECSKCCCSYSELVRVFELLRGASVNITWAGQFPIQEAATSLYLGNGNRFVGTSEAARTQWKNYASQAYKMYAHGESEDVVGAFEMALNPGLTGFQYVSNSPQVTFEYAGVGVFFRVVFYVGPLANNIHTPIPQTPLSSCPVLARVFFRFERPLRYINSGSGQLSEFVSFSEDGPRQTPSLYPGGSPISWYAGWVNSQYTESVLMSWWDYDITGTSFPVSANSGGELVYGPDDSPEYEVQDAVNEVLFLFPSKSSADFGVGAWTPGGDWQADGRLVWTGMEYQWQYSPAGKKYQNAGSYDITPTISVSLQ